VELPDTIVCDVIETKQTGSGNLLAILDTGAKIQVPDFVKVGDRLKVNTSDKAYIERV
jgi:elongation factor P